MNQVTNSVFAEIVHIKLATRPYWEAYYGYGHKFRCVFRICRSPSDRKSLTDRLPTSVDQSLPTNTIYTLVDMV